MSFDLRLAFVGSSPCFFHSIKVVGSWSFDFQVFDLLDILLLQLSGRDLFSSHHDSWTDERNAELIRLAFSTFQTNNQSTPSDLASVVLSRLRYHCHSLSEQHQGPDQVLHSSRGLTSRTFSKALEHSLNSHQSDMTSSSPAPFIAPKLSGLSEDYSLQRSSNSSPSLSFYMRPSYVTCVGQLPKRSKAAIATEDWDHPSFARPPHRSIERKDKLIKPCFTSGINCAFDALTEQTLISSVSKSLESEPLVPNSYPVPPPPPYEQSAAVLADLAAEIVWDRCYTTKARFSTHPSPILPPWDSSFPCSLTKALSQTGFCPFERNSPNHSIDKSTPSNDWVGSANAFGVIGAEAKARRFNRQYPISSNSPLGGNTKLASESRKQLSLGIKTEVKPAFRRWTRQVLEQTLLSPQVLILALYYVDLTTGMDVFGDLSCKMSLLPYKILLASLVLANKTLDDHSYKNSTYANVSSMTNAEVNSIEVALLKALNFNVVPSSNQWSKWLKEVAATGDRYGVNVPESSMHYSTVTSPQLMSNWRTIPERFSQYLASPSHDNSSIFDRGQTSPTPFGQVKVDSIHQVSTRQTQIKLGYPNHTSLNVDQTSTNYYYPFSNAPSYRNQLESIWSNRLKRYSKADVIALWNQFIKLIEM
ncbi:hypothetical protein O181_055334 [Austropuccinia psidii MF-1]|uniref:Cyclin N-terminal domain-containing protein n=1 Tax=Austropuccinia psidii MF-1 TaxID=1389203 RepID=A0A9Q3HUI3_9BASI|nr:hypothetical protein [Austropuccinia psidii MF-1]